MAQEVATANQEAIEAWDGVIFDRFVHFRDLMMDGLAPFGEESYRVCPPQPGWRVLDVGCGFGDSTQRLAELVGPDGEAVGTDSSARFIDTARAETGAANVRFMVADAQAGDLGGLYDAVYSRFGTMFFANPVAALRNIRGSLAPGGRLCMVVWRRKDDNDWVPRAESVVKSMVTEQEDSDELTCGPGPFSMANADTTTAVVLSAGFEEATLTRCDRRWSLGDMDQAVELALGLGPAGEAMRLAGENAERERPRIEAAVREAFSDLVDGDRVSTNISTWIVTARAPAEA